MIDSVAEPVPVEMNVTLDFSGPPRDPLIVPHAKWDREFIAFLNLLPALLQTHRGKYVAIHGGQVVALGEDRGEVAMEAYRKVGYQELLVREVTEQPPRVVRLPSIRVVQPSLSE